MKDEEQVLQNINSGIYKLAHHNGRSPLWKVFADIRKSDGNLIDGYVCCGKCMSFYKYDRKHSSNLNRHKCFLLYMANNCIPENIKKLIVPQKVHCETSNRSIDEIVKVANTKEVNEDQNQEVKDVYIENDYADVFEDVKVCNSLELVSSPEDSQPYQPPPRKRQKSSIDDLTPKVKERNLQQLNSLCEMIKADLHDAPEDLFFIAKWKIMDTLREVQSKRLERESCS